MSVAIQRNMQEELQHELWLEELRFLHDEISILERYLTEIQFRNIPEGPVAKIEHFENQFILQKDWLNKMKHELEGIDEMDDTDDDEWNFIEKPKILPERSSLLTQLEASRWANRELKESFQKFLVKWM